MKLLGIIALCALPLLGQTPPAITCLGGSCDTGINRPCTPATCGGAPVAPTMTPSNCHAGDQGQIVCTPSAEMLKYAPYVSTTISGTCDTETLKFILAQEAKEHSDRQSKIDEYMKASDNAIAKLKLVIAAQDNLIKAKDAQIAIYKNWLAAIKGIADKK
jgi:hypothetical protein